jgi:hypothetical protein
MFSSTGTVGAVATMLVKADSNTGAVEVSVYSKGMLLDRSGGLGISLWARKGRTAVGDEVIRNTFNTALSVDVKATGIVRPMVSTADKRRRRAAIKAAGRDIHIYIYMYLCVHRLHMCTHNPFTYICVFMYV